MQSSLENQSPLAKPVRSEYSWLQKQLALSFDGWGAARRRIRKQLSAREQPENVWGNDDRRCAVAVFVARKAKQSLGWPNDFFIPEDSFQAILLGDSGDGMDVVELMMDIEAGLGIRIPETGVPNATDMTFGEFVDYLLTRPADRKCPPPEGPCAPEVKACPTSAVFWGVREFVRKDLGLEPHSFQPGARLQELFPGRAAGSLSAFLWNTYGVNGCARRKILGVLPFFWSWLAVCLLSSAFIWLKYGWGRATLWSVVIAIVSAVVLRRLATWRWERGLVTVSDLIEWLLKERSVVRAKYRSRQGKLHAL